MNYPASPISTLSGSGLGIEPVVVRRKGGLKDYLPMVQRRATLFLAVFAVVAGVAMAYFLMQPKEYRATAAIMITGPKEQVLRAGQAIADATQEAAVVDNELEMLRSPALMQRVVTRLELHKPPEARKGGGASAPASGIVAPEASDPAEAEAIRSTADDLAKSVSIKRRGTSNIVDVSALSRDPVQAAEIANIYAEAYLIARQEQRLQATQLATGWLSERLNALQKDVTEAEQAKQAYRVQSGLMTMDGVSLTEAQVADLQGSVLVARADVSEKEARYNQVVAMVRAGGSADTLAGALNSDVIRDLRQRESDLVRQQAELENTLGDLHPRVQTGRLEIASAREQIKAEVARIQSSLRNELEVSQARLRTLERSLNAIEGELARNNLSAVRLNELDRTATAAQAVYADFLQRSHELEQQGQLQSGDVRLISLAAPPTRPASSTLVSAVISIALGVVAGLALAALVEWFDDRLRSADDVERRVGVPALASIPVIRRSALRLLAKSDRHPAGYTVDRPLSRYAESLRILRTAIHHAASPGRAAVVAVTSALPGDGKTTISLSLARIAGLAGQRVLLIDCDLRRCSLNALLQIEPKVGLTQVLNGDVPWTKAIGRDESSGAHVLPVAEEAPNPRDMFGTGAMQQLLNDARQVYDLIILDSPPVLAVAEARTLCLLADGAVLVARSCRTRAAALDAVLHQMESIDARVLGVVLNCVDPRVPGTRSYREALYYGQSDAAYYKN